MSKGNSMRKYNKLLTARRNYFDLGGTVGALPMQLTGITPQLTKAPAISDNIKNWVNDNGKKTSSIDLGKIAGIAGLASTAAGHILGAVNEAKGADISSYISSINGSQLGPVTGSDSLESISADWSNLATGRTYSAKDLGAKSTGNIIGGAVGQAASGAAAGASFGPIGAVAGAIGGLGTSLIGSLLGNNKRKKQAAQLTELQAKTDDFNLRSLKERTANALDNTFRALNRNYVNSAAFGGPLNFGGGAIDFNFMDRYIKAKEATAQGQNNVISSMPNSFGYNEDTLRAFGGELHTQGGNFTNGILSINNGGSHESNPFEGVPVGVDSEGTPNLVEEGETIFNDYVFSRRLMVPKAIRTKYKLRGPVSFANASKELAKESEERPNDPISQRGLQAIMSDLASTQETLKAEKQANQFANGGKVNKFDGTSTISNMIRRNTTASQGDYWNSLMGAQLIDKLTYLDSLEGDEREAAIEAFMNEANSLQDSYYKDIYNSGATWGGKALSGVGSTHQANWHKAGYNNYKDYGKWFGARNSTKDRADTWVDNVIGDLTLLRNLGDSRYLSVEQANKLKALSKKLGLDYSEKGDGNTLMYFNRIPSEAPVPESTEPTEPIVEETPTVVEEEIKPAYTPEELYLGRNKLEPLRFAPTIGYGIGALSDIMGLTNKPDYSDADAILEATRNSPYRPVGFNPLGDFLAYRPQDVNRIANTLSSQAAATRAGIESLTGGNAGARAAQLLAADTNSQNQIGQAIMAATEANLAQEAQRAEFNRGTRSINSQGFLQADIANQKALMEAGEFGMKGVMAASQLRSSARQAADAAKSANLSGLFQTLGDIGYEAKNDNMARRAIERGIFGPGAELAYMDIKRKKGGKIRRRKGLTF